MPNPMIPAWTARPQHRHAQPMTCPMARRCGGLPRRVRGTPDGLRASFVSGIPATAADRCARPDLRQCPLRRRRTATGPPAMTRCTVISGPHPNRQDRGTGIVANLVFTAVRTPTACSSPRERCCAPSALRHDGHAAPRSRLLRRLLSGLVTRRGRVHRSGCRVAAVRSPSVPVAAGAEVAPGSPRGSQVCSTGERSC